MTRKGSAKRVRIPFVEAFRSAHGQRDAREAINERDEAGERIIPGRRAVARSAMSAADLQRAVARDLEDLMNTVNFAASTDISDFPAVATSILNYGFTDISRRSIDEQTVSEIGAEIETALTLFEPRLAAGSVAAWRDRDVDPAELKLRFVVRAEIDCDPLNLPVEFIADLEQDTGKISIRYR
ncbi:type VI secretion system baseplate subunit TssE [Methylobacterium sp. J-068]|uniref:type VI secretion system baseplate subunit TssE n=1 Tax=Methylobacterium sp. J-068 TaxID=2836649 RepID=UPI001FB8A6EB|nr:type VI secretion system baseplate subunit TssE [Methylobacterium sp. J-068]MCJ2033858.1 type VI secretion system baseplate subunit TssE [Methylobacterium sp. J-068]